MFRFTLALLGTTLVGAAMQWAPDPAGEIASSVAQVQDFATAPPASRIPADSADSLYRLARESLNRSRYREALQLFQQIRREYPESAYVPDALYWEAFALYRLGTVDNLRAAASRLELQQRRYPQAATRGDGDALLTRINVELARTGDRAAQADVARAADRATAPRPARPPTPGVPVVAAAPATPPAPGHGNFDADCDSDDETQVMALHALMQNDSERALPILRKVLAHRDAASACLRRHAMFVLSTRRDAASADLLLDAARSDPDPDVRRTAVFWLSQVSDERAVPILDSVLQASRDDETRQAALFALGQRRDTRSAAILLAYASRTDIPDGVRQMAIMQLLQSPSATKDPAFARQLFEATTDRDSKIAILMMSDRRDGLDTRWLTSVARDQGQDREVRLAALMRLSSSDLSTAELLRIMDSFPRDNERGDVLMVMLMQRRDDPVVVARLIEIAKTSTDRELRQHAVMMLSQSKDPRATAYLAELLER